MKKMLIKKFGTPDGHDVNTKVVDIDKIYLNMQSDRSDWKIEKSKKNLDFW